MWARRSLVDSTDIDVDFGLRRTQGQPAIGVSTRESIVEQYSARMGFTTAHWSFYETHGLFRSP